MRKGHVIAAFALHVAACGDSAPRCPTGTRSENGVCVSPEDAEPAGERDGEVTGTPPREDGDGGSSDTAANGGGGGAEAGDAETANPTDCYVDEDGDGFGTSEATDCGVTTAADRDGDCNDSSADDYPGAQELCDLADNDCDGRADNGAGNACGGPCTAKLAHAPGEECSNGLLGACSRTGLYVCSGATSVTCDAPQPSPTTEVCGDGVDNDCNGRVDEPTAVDAATWYQDCDGDGYAAFTSGSIKGCTTPANVAGCAWTATIPNPESYSNWDCDDSSATYTPAAGYGTPPTGKTSWDLNCDGKVTQDPSVLRTRFAACSQVVIDWINAGGRAAWLRDSTSNTANCPILKPAGVSQQSDYCTAWVNPAGQLVRDPPAFCPDRAVSLSWTSRMADRSGTYTECSVNTQLGSLWGCR
jgi:Putative metal-binding motif